MGPLEVWLLASVATLNWRMALRYYTVGHARDVSSLLHMEGELSRITSAFIEHLGATHIDGAYDKVLYWTHDNRFPLRLLRPYRGVELELAQQFMEWLRQYYPEWAA